MPTWNSSKIRSAPQFHTCRNCQIPQHFITPAGQIYNTSTFTGSLIQCLLNSFRVILSHLQSRTDIYLKPHTGWAGSKWYHKGFGSKVKYIIQRHTQRLGFRYFHFRELRQRLHLYRRMINAAFKEGLIIDIRFLRKTITCKDCTGIRTNIYLRRVIIKVCIRNDEITSQTFYFPLIDSTLLHHQFRRNALFQQYCRIRGRYFTPIELYRSSTGGCHYHTFFAIFNVGPCKHDTCRWSTIHINTRLAVPQIELIIMSVRCTVSSYAKSGTKTFIIAFNIHIACIRPVVTTHHNACSMLIDPVSIGFTCLRRSFQTGVRPIIGWEMYPLKTPYIGYMVNLDTTWQRSAIHIVDIGTTAPVFPRQHDAAIRIHQCHMTHIAVIVSPYALTPVQDSGRIRFYIIRILVRIPDSKVCQCSRRFHRDKCTGFCLRSTLRIHHQDGSFHWLAFHRPFPFSTHRNTGRNEQLSGNTITTSRNKQYTTTAIFA